METASADIAYVSWLDAFVVRKWGRFPSSHMHLGGIDNKMPRDEPQGMSVIKFRHFPEIGQTQVQMGTLLGLTCCIFPSMTVERAW
jgi:hypothetical protein